jgi:hypothetical protein
MSSSIDAFIAEWRGNIAGERATAQHFLLDPCDALGVPKPTAAEISAGTYRFEKPLDGAGAGGAKGFGDYYKAGCFVLEAKQRTVAGDDRLGTARRDTPG